MRKRGMRKRDQRESEPTRQHIIAKTAALLNKSGYLRTPLSEIMRVTGLQKGGLYHYFSSRDDLALAAFQHNVGLVQARVRRVLKMNASSTEKLLSLIDVFCDFPREEVLDGGCPIVNLAIEADDAHRPLAAAAREAMGQLVSAFERVMVAGMKDGDIRKGNAAQNAAMFVAALEGAWLLTVLYKDTSYLQSVAEHLRSQVKAGVQ